MSVVRKRNFAAILAATAGVGLSVTAGNAATFTWDGNSGIDTEWDTATNWTANTVKPGAADVAQWSGGSTPSPTTVDLGGNEAAQRLNVNGKDVTFDLNTFTLTVGGATTTITDENSIATFNGTGTATFNSRIEVGSTAIANSGEVTTHAKLNVQNGATFNTNAGFVIGDYRTGGIATIDGAGTVWNSVGSALLGESGTGGRIQTQPRSRMIITNGAKFIHDVGAYGTALDETFAAGHVSTAQVLVQVQGAGSEMRFIGGYGSNIKISTSATSTWNILDGGTFIVEDSLDGDEGNLPLSFNDSAQTATFNINSSTDDVSTMEAEYITIGGRSNSDASRGNNIVNVGVNGLLKANDEDGSNIAIGVGEQAILSLQGGSVTMTAGNQLRLLTSSTVGTKATLEGFGTITVGDLLAQADTRIRVGDVNDGAGGVVSGTGTIELTSGNFTSSNLSGSNTATELLFDLQTTANNPHDLIAASGDGSVVTIGNNSTNAITYAVFGGGTLAAGGEGFMDFLIGDAVNYGGTSLGADVPNIDNLDDLLAAAGYSRVSVTPGAGEYRYFLTTVGAGDYESDEFSGQQALRLELQPIPEPSSIAMLGLGMLPLLRRRRR